MKLKFFSVLTLAGAIALSGCSSNNSTVNKESAAPQAGQSETSESPANVNWFSSIGFWNPPQTWSTDPNTVTGTITEKTGLTFSYNIPAQDGETKLSLMMVSSSDAFPDVITVAGDVMAKKLIQADKVWKLDEFLTKYDPDSHLLKEFPNDIKKGLIERDGDWYSMPSHIGGSDLQKQYPPSSEFYEDAFKYGDNKGIMFNEKLMKEAGIALSDLKTEEGVLAAYKKVQDMKLTVEGASVIPLQLDGKNYQGEALQFLQRNFGAMQVDKEGNYRDTLLAPETKQAIEFLFKAAQGGYFDPSQLTVDVAAAKAAVLSGRVFSFIGNKANTGFVDQDVWVSPGPILSEQGTKPVFARSSSPGIGWMQTYISKSTKEPERLAKWLSFMSSPEGMYLHSFGFEGTHYTLNDKGLVEKTEQGLQAARDYSTTGVEGFWPFANGAWRDHVLQAPTSETEPKLLKAAAVNNAYGKAAETVRYDDVVTVLPGDFFAPGSKNASIRDQVQLYKEAQISKMVLAKDEATLNKLYDEYIVQLKELGLTELDAAKNEVLQKKSKDLGITIKGINS